MIPQVCRQYIYSAQSARRAEFLAANIQALHTHTQTHWPDFLVREREMEGVWFGGSVILLTH